MNRNDWGRIIMMLAVLGGWNISSSTAQGQFAPLAAPPGMASGDEASADSSESKRLYFTDRELAMRLLKGQKLVDDQDYSTAVVHLQAILNNPEDFFINVGTDAEPEYRSLKLAAQELIGGLPAEGRKSYELQFGITAQQQLVEAIAADNLVQLEGIARRFFHTEAGYEAMYRLGTSYLNRSQPLTAAVCFSRLQQTSAARRFEPMLSLKLAVCWNQAGMPERCTQALLELKKSQDRNFVVLRGERIPLFEHDDKALDWLVGVIGNTRDFDSLTEQNWTMFQGNPARNASSSLASPVWDAHWQYPTIDNEQSEAPKQSLAIAQLVQDMENNLRDKDFIAIPACQPLVIGDLVVVRTMSGLQALNLGTGRFLWKTIIDDQAYRTIEEESNGDQRSDADTGDESGFRKGTPSPVRMFLNQRAWQDRTAGVLSSDGRLIYSIEELGFAGPRHYMPAGGSHPLSAKDYNKLAAFDIHGRLVWEVGGPRGEHQLNLSGAYFLGPPVPLGDRLYCLAEVSGEIRLLALDPNNKGRLLWSQSILLPEFPLSQHPYRRTAGLSPSAADGILVCPTVSGAVVAVDLSRRLLLWEYRYEDNLPYSPRDRRVRRMMMNGRIFGSAGATSDDAGNRWQDSTPIIAEHHILLTPQDSDELHCLDLIDGSLRWKRPRGEGLYVAGVYDGKVLLVERMRVQAFDLSTGEKAWDHPTPIPLPSGRGCRMQGRYLLPLSTGEVASIDLQTGRMLARSASRENRIPGNLVSAGGFLISQTAHSIWGFKPLDDLQQQLQHALEKDAEDAHALALRGELLLHQGQEGAGLADLRRAVELSGEPRARSVLIATLLEGLRQDFAKYHGTADEINRLIDDPQQRTTYLRLYASGLQKTGQRQAAFNAYLKLSGPDTDDPGMEPLNGVLSVRTDRWVRSRIEELYAESQPDEQAEMDQALEMQLEAALGSSQVEPLRKFLSYFEEQPIAEQARLALIQSFDGNTQTLEIETHLRQLLQSPDRRVVAYATSRLASLLIGQERPHEAAGLVETLASRWADTECLVGKTGAALAEQWRDDYPLLNELANPTPWPDHVEVVRSPQDGTGQRTYPIKTISSSGDSFENWQLELTYSRRTVVARDADGRVRWQLALNQSAHHSGNYALIHGHVMALALGDHFMVLDALHGSQAPKVLWKRDLYESLPGHAARRGPQVRQIIGPRGKPQLMLLDRQGRPMGSVGIVTDRAVCYQVGTKLYSADTQTGEILWERRNITRGSELLGNEDYVFVVAPNSNQALVLKAGDGHQLATRRIAPANQRFIVQGHRVLWWKTQGDQLVLSLDDLIAGRTLWSRKYSQETKADLIGQDEVAVFEPDGQFEILSLPDGQPRWTHHLPAEPNISDILALRSQDRYVLFINRPPDEQQITRVIGTSLSDPIVNGTAYGFDGHSGKRLWETEIKNQAIDLNQPTSLPILVFRANVMTRDRRRGRRVSNLNQHAILVLDTRNGRVLDQNQQRETVQGIEISADRKEKTIEIQSNHWRITLKYSNTPVEDKKAETKLRQKNG